MHPTTYEEYQIKSRSFDEQVKTNGTITESSRAIHDGNKFHVSYPYAQLITHDVRKCIPWSGTSMNPSRPVSRSTTPDQDTTIVSKLVLIPSGSYVGAHQWFTDFCVRAFLRILWILVLFSFQPSCQRFTLGGLLNSTSWSQACLLTKRTPTIHHTRYILRGVS